MTFLVLFFLYVIHVESDFRRWYFFKLISFTACGGYICRLGCYHYSEHIVNALHLVYFSLLPGLIVIYFSQKVAKTCDFIVVLATPLFRTYVTPSEYSI